MMMLLVRSSGLAVIVPAAMVLMTVVVVTFPGFPAFSESNQRHTALRALSRVVVGLGSFALHRTLVFHDGLQRQSIIQLDYSRKYSSSSTGDALGMEADRWK
ncbi:MAG: hypothetical protein A2413_03565 [Treponema sp. RIFOXYC1_FULL_61_9]|nr:MAG: hypothetical protein A2413_03565 [Treponema sp. RIFOXYC1_FULL_61_9]